MNLKSKFLKTNLTEDALTENVELIKEVLKKNDCKMQYKFKKNVLKLKNDHISLVSKGISKEKISCNLCLKHTRLTFADLPSKLIDGVDRCRSLEDTLGNKLFIRFKSTRCASFWQREIEKYNISITEVYRGLTGQICVINEVSDILQGNFVVDVSGDIKGCEMKAIAEERFKMDGLLSLKYSLEIQNGQNIVSVDDRSPIFFINEYLTGYNHPMFCSLICKEIPHAPSKPITLIVLEKTNEQRKNFKPNKICKMTKIGPDLMYNIDQRWPDNLMPTWLIRLLSDIYFYGPECKGIFRLSTPKSFSKSYYELMLTRDDFNIESNMFLKANVLKQFLAKIEGGLLNLLDKTFINKILSNLESATKFLRDVKKENILLKALSTLSHQRLLLLQYILVVFKEISESEKTCMDAYNIGAMCAPSIFNKFKYNITEYSEEAMKLSILLESIILLFEKIVDSQSRQSIVETFNKYKSDPSLIMFEDSQTNSTISESCFSTNSLSTPEKGSEIIYGKKQLKQLSCYNGKESENLPESCVNDIETIISPRTRVCMGSKLFEKLNSSMDRTPQHISADQFNPSSKILEDSIMDVSIKNCTEVCSSNEVNVPLFSESDIIITRSQGRKLSQLSFLNPSIILNDIITIDLTSSKENIAPLVEESVTFKRTISKSSLPRISTRHSSMLVKFEDRPKILKNRKKFRPLSMRQFKEESLKTNTKSLKIKPSKISMQLKSPNISLSVEEEVKSIPLQSIPALTRMSTRHSSMLETSSINSASARQRKMQSRPLSTLNQITRNNSRRYHESEECLENNRSRSPYVKNMVEMYEKRIRSSSSNQEGSHDKDIMMGYEKNYNRKKAN